MYMRALTLLLTCVAALAATALPATAATKKRAPYPVVKAVQPMDVRIGETLRIVGKNFRSGRNRNTVVFKRDGKRALFAKAEEATRTTLTIVVPEKLRPFLNANDRPAKFRLRVLSKRFGKAFTLNGLSPRVRRRATGGDGRTPADVPPPAPAGPTSPTDCDLDGTPNDRDPHDDTDQMEDGFEQRIGTDPCRTDTDGDGLEDGWEYRSAADLNRASCPEAEYPVPCIPATPYPGKRPYPNPLDGSDPAQDFDGDGMLAAEEHAAWQRRGGHNLDVLWYSDGLQASIDDDAGDGCRGMRVPAPLGNIAAYSLDRDQRPFRSGCLDDAERDEDQDFLGNVMEAHLQLSAPGAYVDKFGEPKYPRAMSGLDWLDGDSDGDTVLDGLDDQDHDDFWNIEEMDRGPQSHSKDDKPLSARSGLWVDAYNPCLPAINSRTCPGQVVISDTFTEMPRPFTKPENADDPAQWPKPRWPLYQEALYFDPDTDEEGPDMACCPELWDGLPEEEQTLPPPHPLPR